MQIAPAPAAPNDEHPGITREQADAILQELKSMRELLEQRNNSKADSANR